MAEPVRVAVDAMGGDNAPFVTVKGAVDAAKECGNLKIFLVGQKDKVDAELSKYEYDKDRIEVVDAHHINVRLRFADEYERIMEQLSVIKPDAAGKEAI